MKTFRLKELSIISQEDNSLKRHHVKLTDGLIINKENELGNWLIEAIIPNEPIELLKELEQQEEPFIIEATISREQNTPVPFSANIRKIKILDEHTEILLDAKIIMKKDDLSDLLLEELIKEGLTGKALIQEFKQAKAERGPSFLGIVDKELKKAKSPL
ncbi:YwpF family protein [Bacillus solimangrovi]|uniref:YwpF-like protein n=1 Tax=Bacillus solimangrovi TaxID=1305675 RepID=A0A1E5LDP7_9BACI|nr:YwpF family protein [Bacillus solimangrovi]OEH92170.1 hypothetical protein BFG57_02555 [Bacillus solimangrovi]